MSEPKKPRRVLCAKCKGEIPPGEGRMRAYGLQSFHLECYEGRSPGRPDRPRPNTPTFTVVCDTCPYRSKWATYQEAFDAVLRHRAANTSDQPKSSPRNQTLNVPPYQLARSVKLRHYYRIFYVPPSAR